MLVWQTWCYSDPWRRGSLSPGSGDLLGLSVTLISAQPPPAAIDLLHPCWDKVDTWDKDKILHDFAKNTYSGSLFHAFPESVMLSVSPIRIWSQGECFCWCCFAPKLLSNPSFPTGFLLFWIRITEDVGVHPSSWVEGFSFSVEESLSWLTFINLKSY